jgi:putative sterol carrier protein
VNRHHPEPPLQPLKDITMEYLNQLADKLTAAVTTGPTPDKSIKLNLKDTGVLVVNRSQVIRDDVAADTTISISRKDFESLVAGKLSAPVAFMQGKIKIQGDPGVALQWLPVLQRTSA